MSNDNYKLRQDLTVHLPRILCLHGGGTNARIFRTQCRALKTALSSEFRLVFAQAPFDCDASSDVMAVYSKWGPFKRWLRWRPEHSAITAEEVIAAIDSSLEDAMREDDEQGGAGEWVGLMGFSQGAKVCASLLYRQQVREANRVKSSGCLSAFLPAPTNFRFGILLAGRAPLVSLDNRLCSSDSRLMHASAYRLAESTKTETGRQNTGRETLTTLLKVPTIHVHGIHDPGLEFHRQLFDEVCDPASKFLIEWEGDHRVPLKSKDVALVARQIRELAKEMGI